MTAREPGAGVQRESEGRKRMSCNGCRVLRKGCSDTCILRPCLQWIESPEAQGHATVFVAKFFGRAGLMSFINAVPDSQRPALFQSLLYEACGRTVNPVFGAVGLLGSGNWHVCQAAVDTVLKGGTLRPSQSSSAIATCSSRPSLTSTYRLNSSSAATTSHTAVPSVKTELQLPLSQAQLFTNNQSDDQHRQRELLRRVKSEFPESSFTDSLHHPYRRVRQRLETAEDESGSHRYGSACNDNIANLDLTLNFDGDGWRVKRRVSSPSLVSVNSEGSVTSLESGSLPHRHVHTSSSSLRRIELDLFP